MACAPSLPFLLAVSFGILPEIPTVSPMSRCSDSLPVGVSNFFVSPVFSPDSVSPPFLPQELIRLGFHFEGNIRGPNSKSTFFTVLAACSVLKSPFIVQYRLNLFLERHSSQIWGRRRTSSASTAEMQFDGTHSNGMDMLNFPHACPLT